MMPINRRQDVLQYRLGLPYRLFGFDSDMSEVINHARAADAWMKAGGRDEVAAKLRIPVAAAA